MITLTKKDRLYIVVILIYIDNLLIIGSSNMMIQELKTTLHKKFKMKDLADLKYFLRIEVLRSKSGILLTQKKYTLDLISNYGLSGQN